MNEREKSARLLAKHLMGRVKFTRDATPEELAERKRMALQFEIADDIDEIREYLKVNDLDARAVEYMEAVLKKARSLLGGEAK